MMAKKAKSFVLKKFNTSKKRKSAYAASTYYKYQSLDLMLSSLIDKNISEFGYFKIPDLSILTNYTEKILYLSKKFIRHEFNILGSGWTKVNNNSDCLGFEGYIYLNETKEIEDEKVNIFNSVISSEYIRFVSRNYEKIDWQLDFRSGYRWNGALWHKDIEYGTTPGADIKMPWELGRMQHLIIFSYAYILAGTDKSFGDKQVYSTEFENQVMDFIASNPPEFGVQWITSMDVAIRAINWLICYDYFYKSGHKFSDRFNTIFWESIYQHGKYIAGNLEWSDDYLFLHFFRPMMRLTHG
jgi:hypothetical protein